MPSIKLLFFLAVWKRPEITEICFKGIERIRKKGMFHVEALAVISEEEMIPLCEKYGIQYCFHENLPLGKKKNYGIQEALKRDFDYLIELGSDDLLKDELFDLYLPLFEQRKPLIGIKDFAFMNTETGECRFYTHRISTFGLGRAIRRDVLEKFPALWPEQINHGLDNASHFYLARNGVLDHRVRSVRPLAIDLKSEVNIWPFNYLEGGHIDQELVLAGLSEEEITSIKQLQVCERV